MEDTTSDGIADRLAEFFSSVFSPFEGSVPPFEPSVNQPMECTNITENEVKALIEKLDRRKASGPDGISAYALKMFCKNVPCFTTCLTSIMHTSLNTSVLPTDWKRASICPVFKSGRRDQAGNYRPISLTSLCSKIIEHIIVSSMWKHINKNNIIIENQHGFRKGYNTTTQLLHFTHVSAKAINEKQDFHIISFDFAKAFDKVPHKLIVYTKFANTNLVKKL